MNILDFILITPVVYFCYKGIRKGFIERVLAVIGLVLAGVISYVYGEPFATLISEYWQDDSIQYLAYIILFLLVILSVKAVAITLTKGLKFMALSPLNVFLGALFGVVQGTIISLLAALVLIAVDSHFESPLKKPIQDSYFIQLSEGHLNSLLDALTISF